MAVGWGADATKNNGIVIHGTSAEDVRKVWGALYNPGIITGAVVTPSTTDRSYTVSAGVAVIPIATGEHVIAPIPYTVVPPAAASARTDIIWAKQNLPGTEQDSLVTVGRSTTLPDNAIALARFVVEATDTVAAAGVRTGGVDYAVPYGVAGKILHHYIDKSDSAIPAGTHKTGTGTIHLPTDRKLSFRMRATLNASGAVGFDNTKYCDVMYQIYLDNAAIFTWTSGLLNSARTTYEFENFVNVAAGTHTVHYTYAKNGGPGTPMRNYWGLNGWPGTQLIVTDAGVID